MKNTNSKTIRFDLGNIAQKNREQLSKTPMTNILYLSVFVSVITILLVIFIQGSLPPEIPLFYGFAEGQEQLSSPIGLIIPSICSLTIVIINTMLILKLKNDLLKKSLIIASFATTFFSFVTTIKIILLVGSF
jgi:hypothetical protein